MYDIHPVYDKCPIYDICSLNDKHTVYDSCYINGKRLLKRMNTHVTKYSNTNERFLGRLSDAQATL